MLAGHPTGPQAPNTGAQDSVFLYVKPVRAVDVAQRAAGHFQAALDAAGADRFPDLTSAIEFLKSHPQLSSSDVAMVAGNFILSACDQRPNPQVLAALVTFLEPFCVQAEVGNAAHVWLSKSPLLPSGANVFHRILLKAYMNSNWRSYAFHVGPRFDPKELAMHVGSTSSSSCIDQARQAVEWLGNFLKSHETMSAATKAQRQQWLENTANNLSSQILDHFRVNHTAGVVRKAAGSVVSAVPSLAQ